MADNGMLTEKLLELITEALLRSGLLDRLLEVQKLGVIDIEGSFMHFMTLFLKLVWYVERLMGMNFQIDIECHWMKA